MFRLKSEYFIRFLNQRIIFVNKCQNKFQIILKSFGSSFFRINWLKFLHLLLLICLHHLKNGFIFFVDKKTYGLILLSNFFYYPFISETIPYIKEKFYFPYINILIKFLEGNIFKMVKLSRNCRCNWIFNSVIKCKKK